MSRQARYLITGGGTGGHIFPALAIADALRANESDCLILFAGANGKMEMDLVPARGYQIKGIDIRGFNRKKMLSNLSLPFVVLKSLIAAKSIIKDFKPDVVIGVGGYASGPIGLAAVLSHIPLVLQEQNSFAGITNRLLARFAKAVCVAYPGMEKIFGDKKTHFTGNPVRRELQQPLPESEKASALRSFGISNNNPTVFITGGSLGAGVINAAVAASINEFGQRDVNLLWMTGKGYFERYAHLQNDFIKVLPFVEKMELAYCAADIVVSRAGALSISELACQQKAVILVPSPNVAEDHQTKNANALLNRQAALMIADNAAAKELITTIFSLLENVPLRSSLSTNISGFAKTDAAFQIGEIIRKEAIH